ncbi:MAG: fibronectin type III domain-containing protein [Patescibacteria group bacterium]
MDSAKRYRLAYLTFFCLAMTVVAILLFALQQPASALEREKNVVISPIITNGQNGFLLYWAIDGNALVERSIKGNGTWERIAEVDADHFMDLTIEDGIEYDYRIKVGEESLEGSAINVVGKPTISEIKVSGSTGKSESSAVISFKTDRLAQIQLFYGEDSTYQKNTDLNNALNQSHTIVLNQLKPGTVYHFKIRALDKNGENLAESADQIFNTDKALTGQTVFQIILEALSKAFVGFEKWFNN